MSDTIGSIIKQADAHNRELAEAYFVARDHDRQARERHREEALALAEQYRRRAVASLEAIEQCIAEGLPTERIREEYALAVQTANFLHLVAEGRVA